MPKYEDWQDVAVAEAPKITPRGGSETYEIELVTPLFGGGVEAGVNDASFPIRPTAIRGQLRFWWRATCGRRFKHKDELWRREEEIFGSVDFPSPITVDVQLGAHFSPQFVAPDRGKHFSAFAYALFAVQKGQKVMKEGNKFHVTLRWLSPEQLRSRRAAQNARRESDRKGLLPETIADIGPEIETAMRAWVWFGGLGARTRRGCGALRCKELSPKDENELCEWLGQFNSQTAGTRDWPTLSANQIVVLNSPQSSIDAWERAIALYREFRQGEGVGRNPGKARNQPGRSRFPEPETIRRITGERASQHGRLAKIPDNAFPRAELGLPIVFHFKDKGEPPDTVLYPSSESEGRRDRMASPLILKPIALAGGKAIAAIVPLCVESLKGVDLRHNEKSLTLPNPVLIRDPSLSTYANSPLADRSADGSALEAFLSFAKSNGFQEVMP